MDTTVQIAVAAAIAVLSAVIMGRLVVGQRKKLASVDTLLRERGGMTLDEIAAALGTNVFAKGYLMQALDDLEKEGKLTKTAPPKGHPALRIARDTRYSPVHSNNQRAG